MDLEKFLVSDIALITLVIFGVTTHLGYRFYKIGKHTNELRESTTKLLDAFTNYLTPRITKREDIESMRELARERVIYGI